MKKLRTAFVVIVCFLLLLDKKRQSPLFRLCHPNYILNYKTSCTSSHITMGVLAKPLKTVADAEV
jgi:hypothetical protein